jgi:hypothetical protein
MREGTSSPISLYTVNKSLPSLGLIYRVIRIETPTVVSVSNYGLCPADFLTSNEILRMGLFVFGTK